MPVVKAALASVRARGTLPKLSRAWPLRLNWNTPFGQRFPKAWAEVSVSTAETPVFIERLPAGEHLLRATRPGYEEKLLKVVIEEGKTTTIRFKMEKKQ